MLGLLFVASFFAFVAARLSVSIPLSDQLPFVARVNNSYEWTISPNTFRANQDAEIQYKTLSIPHWLSFDTTSLTFRGQPKEEDKGQHVVTLAASDGETTVSSEFTLPVSSNSPPVLQKSILSQFVPNPSLASVFPIRNGSALSSTDPTLRIPPSWSFSIGFEWDTFRASDRGNVYYDATQADGSPLPSWVKFNKGAITFNGVTPALHEEDLPQALSLNLCASDIKGYTAVAVPFTIFVAAHELSINSTSLPTINVTSTTNFDISLSSPADFSGVYLDDRGINASDIQVLSIDISQYQDWLNYNETRRQLSGTPPAEISTSLLLPAVLGIKGNQTIKTTLPLAIVFSFFTASQLEPISVRTGDSVNYDLTQRFADQTVLSALADSFELTAEYSSTSASEFLRFDPAIGKLNGVVPKDYNETNINITFTAFSRVTHSTSHTSLRILITNAPTKKDGPSKHHAHAMLGLQISCAIIGGLLLLGILLAAFRSCARVPDSALEGEEGRRAWSTEEKRYYGVEGSNPVAELSNTPIGNSSLPTRAISKAEFLGKLRSTIRSASARYRAAGKKRPTISQPIAISAPNVIVSTSPSSGSIFENTVLASCATSDTTSGTGSPTAQSIPRRRLDCVPYKFTKDGVPRSASVTSKQSEDSQEATTSMKVYEEEAVVHTASRAKSVRSAKSTSGLSYLSIPAVSGRPRLVPFISGPLTPTTSSPSSPRSPGVAKRVNSQHAMVERRPPLGSEVADDLSLGVHYVRSLGEDARDDHNSLASSSPGRSLSVRDNSRHTRYSSGSFSLASSKYTQRDERGTVPQILARVDDCFKFRLQIAPNRPKDASNIKVRLTSGNPLPAFIVVEMSRGELQVWGIPRAEDVGEINLGAYDSVTGECIGRALVEVVSRD